MKVGINKIEYYLPPEMEDAQVLLRENPDWPIENIEQTQCDLHGHARFDQRLLADQAPLVRYRYCLCTKTGGRHQPSLHQRSSQSQQQ